MESRLKKRLWPNQGTLPELAWREWGKPRKPRSRDSRCLDYKPRELPLSQPAELLSANIKLTVHKALIRSVMTYAFPAWEFSADAHLMKLQHLRNRVLRTNGRFRRRIPVRDLHTAFNLPYIYDYLTKLCRQQAEVTKSCKCKYSRHRNRWSPTDKIRRRGLNLAAVKCTTFQVTRLPL
jgi:hypothetical protein